MKTITVQEMVNVLNEALELDPRAIRNLFSVRTNCRRELAGHEAIQVDGAGDYTTLGMLGLINGFFGHYRDGREAIVAYYDGARLDKFGIWHVGEDGNVTPSGESEKV